MKKQETKIIVETKFSCFLIAFQAIPKHCVQLGKSRKKPFKGKTISLKSSVLWKIFAGHKYLSDVFKCNLLFVVQ